MVKINTGYDLDLHKIFDGKNLYQSMETLKKYTEECVSSIEKVCGKAEQIVFDIDSGYDNTYIGISYYRMETDQEFENRIEVEERLRVKEEQRKQKQLKKDRAEYERLKKLFEKES